MMAVTEICDLCFQSNSSRNTTTQHISAAVLCSNVFKSPSSNDVLASFVIIKVMVILLLYVAFRKVWCLNLHYIKEHPKTMAEF